jgi:glycerophosphoryl diester phosphodiesterase
MRTETPFLVAHRAGNNLGALRVAERAGVRVVEADLRLCGGLAEVRHAKSVGRLPVLYDEGQWRVSRGRLPLAALLEAASDETELLLDLKDDDVRLAEVVAAGLGGRAVTVCARAWRLLEPFAGVRDIHVLRSIGSHVELAAFLRSPAGSCDGVSIAEWLVDEALVSALRERAGVVVAWTVNTPRRAARLLGWGVDGITTDELGLVGRAFRAFTKPLPVALAA